VLTTKVFQDESQSLVGLQGFVEVYQEVAAGRMQKVRQAVLKTRQFLDGLAQIFTEVKLAYVKEVGPPAGGESKLNKNGQTVAVLLSANAGLYGDIVDRTFDSFIKYSAQTRAQAVIVGKLGLRLIQQRHPEILYNYFDLSDELVDVDSLR